MDGVKVCTKCRRELPLDAFNRRSDTKDGHAFRCRMCESEDRRARRHMLPAAGRRNRTAEHHAAKVRALSRFLADVDGSNGCKPHSATWWRQAARDGGFCWAGYADIRAALAQAGIEPFDLSRGNLFGERRW